MIFSVIKVNDENEEPNIILLLLPLSLYKNATTDYSTKARERERRGERNPTENRSVVQIFVSPFSLNPTFETLATAFTTSPP